LQLRFQIMSAEPHILELVQEVLDSSRTPEEVCADCPELLPEVRKRWSRVRRVDSQLAAIFPSADSSFTRGIQKRAKFRLDGDLPKIPGYEVEAVLGHGGMGVVYKAMHLKLNRAVALKMMIYGTAATPLELARFQREAEAIARLRHPQIVQIYDVGDAGGRPFYTMEFVDGGSLAQKLAGKPQAANVAATIVAALARAVQTAHDEGIVHRDLKPSNILLTADGAVKISDFGLARRSNGEQTLTLSGVRVGTPSYMAPEQALGKASALNPSVDIYALGALLYEMLTGRPPFRAETAAETQRQVVSEDPALPSRLNANVPRDLETICLKCLSKDPSRRYATAAELAEDLQHFLRGEPISARRPGSVERVGKWMKRRPSAAGLIVASSLFTAIVITGMVWITIQQSNRKRAIEADLRDISRLQGESKWTDARAALERAEALVDEGGVGNLSEQVAQARRNHDLVVALDRIQLNRLTSAGDFAYYKSKADDDYMKAFKRSGLADEGQPAHDVAARVNASAVRTALMQALDDWAVCAADKQRRDWLLEIARTADHESSDWGDRIRDSEKWNDLKTISDLAEYVPINGQSTSLLLALGERLRIVGVDASGFLQRVQIAHPADFWANMYLGEAFSRGTKPVEAASFYRAALASRPAAAVAYTALGDCLKTQNRLDEAIGYYRQALVIDPRNARGQTDLANFLSDTGEVEEALDRYQKALKSDRNYAWAHLGIANILRRSGANDEALEHYRQFHNYDPTIPYVENILRSDLVCRGRGDEVLAEWKKALELDPPQHDAWFGYAELCLFMEHEDEYHRACADLIQRFGDRTDPYIAEQTSRAILLAPHTEEELRVGVALADRAVAADPKVFGKNYLYFLFAKGLAEYRQGNYDEAMSIMKTKANKVLGPCPKLVIAMAQYRLGDQRSARNTLTTTIMARDWSMDQVRSHDQWLWHVLRREAEAMIFPHTSEFLEGKYEPQDNTERLALIGVCQAKGLNCAAAQLFVDGFAADPTLVSSTIGNQRYAAACVAALAGAGIGQDARQLEGVERTRWRQQAREWLTSELEAINQRADGASVGTLKSSIAFLKQWQSTPNLAGIRQASALEEMSPDERESSATLWSGVDNLIASAQSQVAASK